MANPVITSIDNGSVVVDRGPMRDETLAFPGADTYVEGTLLARREVSSTVTVTPDGGNTGDGTVTAAAPVAGDLVPLVGNYNLECIEAVTNGGIFKLEDPNGALVTGYIDSLLNSGVVEAGGLTFTITDGAADFVAGDKFTLAVAADGDIVVYSATGVGGAQKPIGVLTYEVVATGAQDVPFRMMQSGVVAKNRLVIDGGGSITTSILDQLRKVGIVAKDFADLSVADNS